MLLYLPCRHCILQLESDGEWADPPEMGLAKVEQLVAFVAGASKSAPMGEVSLAKSLATGEQRKVPHANNLSKDSSPTVGASYPTRYTTIHGNEMEMLESSSNVGGPMAPLNISLPNNSLQDQIYPTTLPLPVVRISNRFLSVPHLVHFAQITFLLI